MSEARWSAESNDLRVEVQQQGPDSFLAEVRQFASPLDALIGGGRTLFSMRTSTGERAVYVLREAITTDPRVRTPEHAELIRALSRSCPWNYWGINDGELLEKVRATVRASAAEEKMYPNPKAHALHLGRWEDPCDQFRISSHPPKEPFDPPHVYGIDPESLAHFYYKGAPHVAIVDVRHPSEFHAGHIPGAINIPIDQIGLAGEGLWGLRMRAEGGRLAIIFVCKKGLRSACAAKWASRLSNVGAYSLEGGMDAWVAEDRDVESSPLEALAMARKNPPVTKLIPGGRADGMDFDDFDPKQLEAGVKVELEHTERPGKQPTSKDKAIAKEIAADHLAEIPDYYTWLLAMEKMAEQAGVLKKPNPRVRRGETVAQKTARVRSAVFKAPVRVQMKIAQGARELIARQNSGERRELTLEEQALFDAILDKVPYHRRRSYDKMSVLQKLTLIRQEEARLRAASSLIRPEKARWPAQPEGEVKPVPEFVLPERLWPISDWYLPHIFWLKTQGAGGATRLARAVEEASFSSEQPRRPIQANLRGMDLSEADLSGLDLRGVLFGDAILFAADFRSSNLEGADLREAGLMGARFGPSDPGKPRTDLRRAMFSTLYKVDFRDANLSGASFYKATVQECDFTDALMLDVDLTQADLSTSNLTGANMEGARTTGALMPKEFDAPRFRPVATYDVERRPVRRRRK